MIGLSSFGFSVAVINTMAGSSLGRKGFISPYGLHHAGEPGKESEEDVEVGGEAQTMDECCFLTCSPGLCLPTAQDYLPRGSPTHSGLSPPVSLNNPVIKNIPPDMLTGQYNWGNSPTKAPSSQLTTEVSSTRV